MIIGGIFLALTLSVSAESLKDALKAAKGGKYIAPDFAEVYKAEVLFTRTLKNEQSPNLQKAWQAQGFTMRALTLSGTHFVVVEENANQRTGRGFYLFRQSGGLPVALQAPHSFKDFYTRQIARLLMLEGNYVAAGWNTVPRYGKNKSKDFADMAHIENTIFQAFGRAFVKQYPTGRIVQLHGFAQEKRKTNASKTADMVLSETTINPSRLLLNTSKCLKENLTEFVVRLYPYEILELGGTTNSNAKDLRKRGFNSFFHVELSKRLRQLIRKNKRIRLKFSACFK